MPGGLGTFPSKCKILSSIPSTDGKKCWVWWSTSVIPELRRQRHKDHKFEANLSNIVNTRPTWTT
jgi:hypothetical protein